jgi:MFS transporter, DHA2 family, multidrug resistance protein
MFLVSRLIGRIRPPLLVLAGMILTASGTLAVTWYNLAISPMWIMLPGVFQGLSMGMVFVSLSTVAYQTLPSEATDQA